MRHHLRNLIEDVDLMLYTEEITETLGHFIAVGDLHLNLAQLNFGQLLAGSENSNYSFYCYLQHF